jgi:peptidoglycan/xylan/chitin deacetylase (PgdA/CDA1 family)
MRRFAACLLLLGALLITGCTPGRATTATTDDLPLTRAPIQAPKVALTFDVTWGDVELRKILAILQQHGAKATFFVGGTFMNAQAPLIRQIAAQGHEIGTLGQRIINLATLPETEVRENLLASQSVLNKTLGGTVRYFRPPQGGAPPELVRAARAAGLITVTHSLDSADYEERQAASIARRVTKQAVKGDIIHLTASDFSPETTKALPAILAGLKAKGLEPVTISQLGQ